MESNGLLKEALGETSYENNLDEKHRESDPYGTQITPWEVGRYIGKLYAARVMVHIIHL